MLSYCFKCRKKKTEIKSPVIQRQKKGKLMHLSNCLVWDSKKPRAIKK